jgi:hypothetical protein
MQRERHLGRLAGLLYLTVVMAGMFSLGFVPSRLGLGGDLNAAMDSILASESLFRSGLASFLVMQVAFLMLVLVLHQLLGPVSRTAATLMVAFATVSVPLGLVALSHRIEALTLLMDSRQASAVHVEALRAQAQLALGAYHPALLVARLFWGLWLLPFAYLVLRSGFLPRLLGGFLVLGCFGYVIEVLGQLLLPGFSDTAISGWVTRPAAVGEIGIALWLLVRGAVPQGRTA